MGTFQDIGQLSKSANADDRKALQYADLALSLISDFEIVATGISDVLALFDNLDTSVTNLVTVFNEFWADMKAVVTTIKMALVADQVGMARAAKTTLQENLGNARLGDPNNPLIALVIHDTNQVVKTLGLPDYWEQPYFPSEYYKDYFVGGLLPGTGDGVLPPGFVPAPNAQIFDYRLTLPAFLEAIIIRLMVLAAPIPNNEEMRKTEYPEMADTLEFYFQKIRNGIVSIPAPSSEEALSGSSPFPIRGHLWANSNRPYGAIDTYGGRAVIDPFPSNELPTRITGIDRFLFYHALGTLARWRQVYKEIDLPRVKTIVNCLKGLAGEPALPITLEDTGGWSLREVIDLSEKHSVYLKPPAPSDDKGLVFPPPQSVRNWLLVSFGLASDYYPSIPLRATLDKLANGNIADLIPHLPGL